MTKRKIDYWVIPPEADGEFVANMEEVLETYAQPYDSKRPVVCMDEQPIQMLKETRVPISATKSHPRRVDMDRQVPFLRRRFSTNFKRMASNRQHRRHGN